MLEEVITNKLEPLVEQNDPSLTNTQNKDDNSNKGVEVSNHQSRKM